MSEATRAIVRLPSELLAQGELTHQLRRPVDAARAREEHAAYVALLEAHGLELTYAPPAPEHPDGLFVEDTLVVIAGRALLTRPGAASRRAEVNSVEPLLVQWGLASERVVAPATLDGGDVLVTERDVFVGQSSRTNEAALAQLQGFAAGVNRRLIAMPVSGALHLKTAVTRLPDGALIAWPACVDTARLLAFGYRVHHAPEASGSNVLCLGETVVLSRAAPDTAALLRQLGYRVVAIAIDELHKLEAGVTCLSVLL